MDISNVSDFKMNDSFDDKYIMGESEKRAIDLITNCGTRTRFYDCILLQQNFPFRYSLINYIVNNPSSSKLYQKMIQTCKYFFIKNPILVVSDLHIYYHKNEWCIEFEDSDINFSELETPINLILNKMTSKIWLTNKAGVFGNLNSDVICDISSIFSQIYRCDVKEFMCFEYYIFYNAFMFFAEKAEKICLLVANVINNEDSSVALEKLIEGLPNLKDLNYYTEDDNENIITPTTFQKLLKIPHFLTLDKLTLRYIPEVADIDIFSDYIKRNKKTRIHFEFWYELSEQYKTRLQEIIDEIVETEYHEYKVPLIEFQGHTNYTKLRELYGSY